MPREDVAPGERTTTRMPAVGYTSASKSSTAGAFPPVPAEQLGIAGHLLVVGEKPTRPILPGITRDGERCTIVHDNLGRPRVVSSLGTPLGYLVTPREHDRLAAAKEEDARQGDGAGLIAIAAAALGGAVVVVCLVYGGFIAGRAYQRDLDGTAAPRFAR